MSVVPAHILRLREARVRRLDRTLVDAQVVAHRVQAVLTLHAPKVIETWAEEGWGGDRWGDEGDASVIEVTVCATCMGPWTSRRPEALYPCPTRRLLTGEAAPDA